MCKVGTPPTCQPDGLTVWPMQLKEAWCVAGHRNQGSLDEGRQGRCPTGRLMSEAARCSKSGQPPNPPCASGLSTQLAHQCRQGPATAAGTTPHVHQRHTCHHSGSAAKTRRHRKLAPCIHRHIRMHIHIHIRRHIHRHTHAHTCTYIYTFTYAYAYTYTCIYRYKYIHVRMLIYNLILVHMHIHVCLYIHIRIHIRKCMRILNMGLYT